MEQRNDRVGVRPSKRGLLGTHAAFACLQMFHQRFESLQGVKPGRGRGLPPASLSRVDCASSAASSTSETEDDILPSALAGESCAAPRSRVG